MPTKSNISAPAPAPNNPSRMGNSHQGRQHKYGVARYGQENVKQPILELWFVYGLNSHAPSYDHGVGCSAEANKSPKSSNDSDYLPRSVINPVIYLFTLAACPTNEKSGPEDGAAPPLAGLRPSPHALLALGSIKPGGRDQRALEMGPFHGRLSLATLRRISSMLLFSPVPTA